MPLFLIAGGDCALKAASLHTYIHLTSATINLTPVSSEAEPKDPLSDVQKTTRCSISKSLASSRGVTDQHIVVQMEIGEMLQCQLEVIRRVVVTQSIYHLAGVDSDAE